MNPSILYKCPGPHRGPNGTCFAYQGVDDKDLMESLLSKGWSKTIEDAIESAGDLAITKLKAVKPKKNKFHAGLPSKPKIEEVEEVEELIETKIYVPDVEIKRVEEVPVAKKGRKSRLSDEQIAEVQSSDAPIKELSEKYKLGVQSIRNIKAKK